MARQRLGCCDTPRPEGGFEIRGVLREDDELSASCCRRRREVTDGPEVVLLVRARAELRDGHSRVRGRSRDFAHSASLAARAAAGPCRGRHRELGLVAIFQQRDPGPAHNVHVRALASNCALLQTVLSDEILR
jgi:hypothetical protein